MSALIFNDPELQKAVSDFEQDGASYMRRVSEVSADISSLEKFLTDSGIRLPASVEVAHAEVITWERGEPDRWRICHRGTTARPLIETPAAVRLRVREYLPKLVSEVARVAKEALS